MRVDLTIGQFYQLEITSGTVQNVGDVDIEITDTQTAGSGIIIEPWEKFSFHNETLYAYAKNPGYKDKATITVVPFERAAGRWDLDQIDDMSEFMQGLNKLTSAAAVKSGLGIAGMTAEEATAGTSTTDREISAKVLADYVASVIAGLVNSAPAALDTLNELAAALGDDANFATTVTNALADKLGKTETAVNAQKVNNLTVETAVPANALFTDTWTIDNDGYIVPRGNG